MTSIRATVTEMELRCIRITRVPSLTSLPATGPITLLDEPLRRATLVDGDAPGWEHVIRRHAIGIFMAQRLGGASRDGRTVAQWLGELEAQSRELLGEPGHGVLLCLEAFEREPAALGQAVELGDHRVTLDDAPFERTMARLDATADLAAAVLVLAGFDGVLQGSRTVGTVAYAFEADEACVTYLLDAKVSASMSVRARLDAEQADEAAQIARALAAAPDNLRHVPRLLSASHAADGDPLHAFMTAWTALEAFVTATFPIHEEEWAKRLAQVPGDGSGFALARIRQVMKGRFRLDDKFAIVAGALDPEHADADLREFSTLRRNRNRFLHTLDGDPAGLPVGSARRLVAKYLPLHLRRR